MISEFKDKMNHSCIHHLQAHQGMMGSLYPQQLQVQFRPGVQWWQWGARGQGSCRAWLGINMENWVGPGGKHSQAWSQDLSVWSWPFPLPPFLWALNFHPQNKPERSFLKALSADTKILIISQNLVLLCFSLLMTMWWRKRSCPHSLSQSHTWNLRGETRLLSLVHEKYFKFQRNREARYPCTLFLKPEQPDICLHRFFIFTQSTSSSPLYDHCPNTGRQADAVMVTINHIGTALRRLWSILMSQCSSDPMEHHHWPHFYRHDSWEPKWYMAELRQEPESLGPGSEDVLLCYPAHDQCRGGHRDQGLPL